MNRRDMIKASIGTIIGWISSKVSFGDNTKVHDYKNPVKQYTVDNNIVYEYIWPKDRCIVFSETIGYSKYDKILVPTFHLSIFDKTLNDHIRDVVLAYKTGDIDSLNPNYYYNSHKCDKCYVHVIRIENDIDQVGILVCDRMCYPVSKFFPDPDDCILSDQEQYNKYTIF